MCRSRSRAQRGRTCATVLASERAMRGVRYLFPCRSGLSAWQTLPSRNLRKTNVEGTRIVMQEALRASVQRIVHTSSAATLALRPDGAPADESASSVGGGLRKKRAEQDCRRAYGKRHGHRARLACGYRPIPAARSGPGDLRPTPTGRVISRGHSKKQNTGFHQYQPRSRACR